MNGEHRQKKLNHLKKRDESTLYLSSLSPQYFRARSFKEQIQ